MKVQYRGGFSDRYNIDKLNTIIQYNELDERTRIKLSNYFVRFIDNLFYNNENIGGKLYEEIWSEVYLQSLSKFEAFNPYDMEKVREAYNYTFILGNFDEVFSLLEFLIDFIKYNLEFCIEEIQEEINNIFEKEYVGYRFINNLITPITSDIEIESIEKSISKSKNNIAKHLDNALRLLSNRKNPDYPNSIKESISAVEAKCNLIVGEQTTLGDALKKLEKKVKIHPSLKEAFNKIYGYTSDANGIRHAGNLDGSEATFEEAQYMLVTCSAFINYLNGIESKHNI